MVWLHSLQGHAEHASALEINLSIHCDDSALHIRPRPEGVAHRTPRRLRIRAKVACPVRSAHESRCRPYELHIHHAILVDGGFDGVGRAIFGQLHRDAVRVEGVLLLVEAVVLERVAGPEEGLLVVRVEDLAVELGGDAQAAGRNEYLASLSIWGQHSSYATLLYMTCRKQTCPLSAFR